MRRLLADLWNNLHHGVAFSLFMRRGRQEFRIGLDQLLMMLLFFLALDVAIDRIVAGAGAEFNHYAFAHFAINLLLFSLGTYLAAVLLQRREAVVMVLLVAYSSSFLLALLQNALLHNFALIASVSEGLYTALFYLLFGWGLLVLLRTVLLAFEVRKRALLLVAPLFYLVWLWPMSVGGWERDFWYAGYTPREDGLAEFRKVDAEGLFYAQPRMVDEALEQLLPQRPGVSDLYFVSFGGYAFQDVFMKEVGYAHRTMDARYGTAGRSLELVNNLKTHDALPLATASNLRKVLQGLGEQMDGEEDLLMLYLSSHGSEQHELAVDFWPLPLNDITPEMLRGMLDEAGIKWRIIVVSACYSGGFIEALRDEHTLVATAAARDRQSFGCGNENDFTYYGEALFRDELGRGEPLLSAFRQARERIHAREKREELEHSLPQLFIGKAIEVKLGEMAGGRLLECGESGGALPTVGC